MTRKLSKTDSLRDLSSYFSENKKIDKIKIKDVEFYNKNLVNTASEVNEDDEFAQESEEEKQQFTD